MSDAYTGKCLCGAVRWQATGAPVTINYCHCEMCRRASGAPVVAWATFLFSAVTFTPGPVWRRSSEKAQRAFCGNCGSPLAWRGDNSSQTIDLTIGTADRPDTLVPTEHIWTENSVSWLKIDDPLPRHKQRGSV